MEQKEIQDELNEDYDQKTADAFWQKVIFFFAHEIY